LKAVIFDLDGVIFDSRHVNILYYNHILEKVGLPPTAEQAAEVIHREDMINSLKYLMGEGEKFNQAMAYWRGMDPAPFIAELRLFPHVRETLAGLAGRFALAVATNRTQTAVPSLEYFGLAGFFPLVVTPMHTKVAKPDPYFMHYTLGELDLKPEQVLYVGDSIVDEKLCQDSGVRLVAFANPELAAWAHVNCHKELLGLLSA